MTARVLLAGAGEAGARHLAALAGMPGVTVAAVADPVPSAPVPAGAARYGSWQEALGAGRFDLVIAAAPPGVALAAGRAAASAGAAVIVEKPAVVSAAALGCQEGDERIFVGFQPHFAPGLEGLLSSPPRVTRAEVVLEVRRDPGYYRGWRRSWAASGGVLHQQAIHGLALALRLMPGPCRAEAASAAWYRGLGEAEDRVTATLALDGGRRLLVDARTDFSGAPRHEVTLWLEDGRVLRVRGRNLEAGLGDPAAAPSHDLLRRQMYAAVLAASAGGPVHPCLFPLPALGRPLEVIDHVYHAARAVRAGAAAV